MAIGRESTDGVTDAIQVSVFDGTFQGLDDAETVTIGGVPLRSIRFGDWLALFTEETPTVMVLDAVEASDTSGELSLHLPSRPDGYTEIVPPRPLGPDHEYHRTLASASGDVGINEVSHMTDPLLAASGAGVDLAAATSTIDPAQWDALYTD